MSLQTWKDEFYPVEADAAAGSDIEAVDHSILKWSGLTIENRVKHGVDLIYDSLIGSNESEPLGLSGSCALCSRHPGKCDPCPLMKVRVGGDGMHFACGSSMGNEENSPWRSLIHGGDPKPMQIWLAKARELVLDEISNQTKDGHESANLEG